tara:strand:- start:147 stop:332 length:186 start_codon:yes stop_codon:yes gene_type:complete
LEENEEEEATDDKDSKESPEEKGKRSHDQLLLALYLGIGMTALLVAIGCIVECIRKNYFPN